MLPWLNEEEEKVFEVEEQGLRRIAMQLSMQKNPQDISQETKSEEIKVSIPRKRLVYICVRTF